MIWKILTLAMAGLALWAALRRAFGPPPGPPAARPGSAAAEDFAPCPSCGAWTARGATCPCRTPPIP